MPQWLKMMAFKQARNQMLPRSPKMRQLRDNNPEDWHHYQSISLDRREEVLRIGAERSIPFWFLCFALDWVVYPDLIEQLWLIRAGFIAFLGLLIANIYLGIIQINVKVVTFLMLVASSVAIGLLLVVINEPQSPYVLGLIVNGVLLTLIFGLKKIEAIFYSLCNVAVYCIAIAGMDNPDFGHPLVITSLVHMFFVFNYCLLQIGHEEQVGFYAFLLDRKSQRQKNQIKSQVESLAAKNREILDSQNTIVQMSKLASVGEMTATLMHEIRNPLNHISGALDYYRQHGDGEIDKADIADVMGDIDESHQRIISTITDLSNFVYQESVDHKKLIDLDRVIERSIRLSQESTLRFDVHWKRSTPAIKVCVAENQFVQVFVNLISNAQAACADAPGEHGAYIETAIDQQQVIIRFWDDGPGLPEKVRKQLFKPFVTTKSKGEGTGLGLKILKMIVNAHGGDIEFKGNRPGACFEITLPMPDSESTDLLGLDSDATHKIQ